MAIHNTSKKSTIFRVRFWGDRALFTNPATFVSGDKVSYPIPTVQALTGMLGRVYWHPPMEWKIKSLRVMNLIQTVAEVQKYRDPDCNTTTAYLGNVLYLKDVDYEVECYFEINEMMAKAMPRPDTNVQKHEHIFEKKLERGPARLLFLGTAECPGFAARARKRRKGAYDSVASVDFGVMYQRSLYPNMHKGCDQQYRELWKTVMKNGIVSYDTRPKLIREPWILAAKIEGYSIDRGAS